MSEREIDRLIEQRLQDERDDGTTDSVVSQAFAVLIDADLTEEERALGIRVLMSAMLDRLSSDELERFTQIALNRGEHAALEYLLVVAEPGP